MASQESSAPVAAPPARQPTVVTDMDEAYKLAGGRGKYQIFVAISCWISLVTFMCFTFSVPYFLEHPQVQCKFADGIWTNCEVEYVCNDPSVTHRFVEGQRWNFATEFGLLCDESKGALISSAYFVGSIFSCLIVNTLSDVVGRLPMMVVGNMGNIFCLGILLLFPSYEMVVAMSAFIGFITIGNNSNSYSFVYDSFPSDCAILYGTLVSISWSLGEVAIALVMWPGTTWRSMCVLLMGVSASFFVILPWIRESPRFYFSKMQPEIALEKLKYVAQVNGVQLPEGLELRCPGANTKLAKKRQAKSSIATIFRSMCCSGKMVVKIGLFSLVFSTSTFVFYALSLNIDQMSGSIYVLGLITAIAEIISTISAGLLLERIGKKASLALYFCIAAAGVLGEGLMWSNPFWSVVFAYFTKFGATAADSALYLFVAELFPTSIKNAAFGIAIFVSRLASTMSKPMALLQPMTMCGIMMVMCVVAAIVAVFMPIMQGAAIVDIAAVEEEGSTELKEILNISKEESSNRQ